MASSCCGVSIEEGRRTVAAWAERAEADDADLPRSRRATRAAAYQVTATPTVFLVGRDGKLVAKALGTKAWTSEPGRALLSHLR